MRMSQLFGLTLREAPADTEVASHQLLIRAGFIRPCGAGIFSYLPLAQRVIQKIQAILRSEMNAIGGQEMCMPVVQPADLWKQTGRWYQIGSEMGRFKDKNERDMVLAMTHEEMVADLVRSEVQSRKHLPRLIYHIQTKWRDDPRPRAGLIRVREFTMKDSYSLDADYEGLDQQYQAHYQTYFNIFHRCGLPVIAVKADVGMMGGKMSHEYLYVSPVGEDTLLLCDACGYKANRQVAVFRKPAPAPEAPLPLEKVATPDTKTIDDLAALLGIPKAKTAKAVFFMAMMDDEEKFVFCVVRGDMNLNENKLTNVLKASNLRPATEAEIRAVGAAPGYASPIGLKDVLVVVDDLIPQSPNLVAGANENGYHLLNTNYGRDYQATIIADIVAAEESDPCPQCGAKLLTRRGIEVGNIFKLGTRYSEAMNCKYHAQDGTEQYVVMGSYGIGVGRLMACVAEEYHDEKGLRWPITIAPYTVHLVALKGGKEMAEKFYQQIKEAGIEILYDDREESPGVKFNDADLIGCPIRITIGERAIKNGGVEMKLRSSSESIIVPFGHLISQIQSEAKSLQSEIFQNLVEIPRDDDVPCS